MQSQLNAIRLEIRCISDDVSSFLGFVGPCKALTPGLLVRQSLSSESVFSPARILRWACATTCQTTWPWRTDPSPFSNRLLRRPSIWFNLDLMRTYICELALPGSLHGQASERYLRLGHINRYCKPLELVECFTAMDFHPFSKIFSKMWPVRHVLRCCLRAAAVLQLQGSKSEAEYYTQQAWGGFWVPCVPCSASGSEQVEWCTGVVLAGGVLSQPRCRLACRNCRSFYADPFETLCILKTSEEFRRILNPWGEANLG